MYGKIFASMFRGSLYGKWQAIITFQQMIILADQDGIVDYTPEALSATTSIPLEIIKEGIALLESPDPATRTPGEEGRRIVLTNPDRAWGWHIVNYAQYREIRTAEERRAYHRKYWTKRTQHHSTPLNNTQQTQPIVEAEVKAEAIHTELPEWLDVKLWDDFKQHRLSLKTKVTPLAEKRLLNTLEKLRAEGNNVAEVINRSIENGWKGLFPLKNQQKRPDFEGAI